MNSSKKKIILVTGGAGFIGSHLVDRLMDRGDAVVVVDNFNRFYSPKRKHENLSHHEDRENFYLASADIRDANAMKRLFSKFHFDCVVHLAAMAGVRPSIEKPLLYADVNVLGTLNILHQIKHFAVPQLVFASSSSVYGNRSRGPFKETDRTDEQISPYGATKKAGELLCYTYARLYGIKTTVLRLFTVYGPRNRPDMACFKFLDALMKGKSLVRFGGGNSARDYTYINDIVDGIEAAIDRPFQCEVINLGNSRPLKLNSLLKTLEKITGKNAKIDNLPLQPGDVRITYADISRASRLLGYSPRMKLREGLEHMSSWYSHVFTS